MFVLATDEDVSTIVPLINRAYRGTGDARPSWSTEGGYISGPRTTEALFRAELAAKPGCSFLKWIDMLDGPLQGCVLLDPLDNGVWYLSSLAIDPDKQNGGMGKVLLSSAEEWVREHGGRRVSINVVNIREALIGWYTRRGYCTTGETQPWPYGDNRYGTPLRDDLCFVFLEKDLAVTDEAC